MIRRSPASPSLAAVLALLALVGGVRLRAAESHAAASKGRVVSVERVRAAQPEVVLASWCGKAFDEAAMRARLGDDLPAMRAGRVHEVSSTVILQPGPACLTEGLDVLEALLAE